MNWYLQIARSQSLLVISLIVGLSATAIADKQRDRQRSRGHHIDKHGHQIDRLVDELQLTAAQEAQVRRLGKAQRSRIGPQREQIRTLRRALRLEWESAAPDRARILAIHETMSQSKQLILEAKVDFRLAVHGMLSPEQRALARQLRNQRVDDRRKRRLGSDGPRALQGPHGLPHDPPNVELPERDGY